VEAAQPQEENQTPSHADTDTDTDTDSRTHTSEPEAKKRHADKSTEELRRTIHELQKELNAKEDYLQATQHEMSTKNEELKASHEELQSINEEMQSTNEELQTSKEELESVNEELRTVNTELEDKVRDLSRAYDDMNNLLSGTEIGMVFVDNDTRIQRFTPMATKVLNLIDTDVGRPLEHISSRLKQGDGLVEDVNEVLETLKVTEKEVKTKEGNWYLLSIRPYRTRENYIEGVLITNTNIDKLKRREEQIATAEAESRRLAAIVRDANDAIVMQDMEGRIRAWNPGAERMYGWSEEEALEQNFHDMMPGDNNQEAMQQLRKNGRSADLQPVKVKRRTKRGDTIEVSLIATTLLDQNGDEYAISTTERLIEPEPEKDTE
jgi:two-component system CheB/CheR fusion protein